MIVKPPAPFLLLLSESGAQDSSLHEVSGLCATDPRTSSDRLVVETDVRPRLCKVNQSHRRGLFCYLCTTDFLSLFDS